MHEIDRIRVAPESAIVYEHGWQSWSPSTSYPLPARPLRPARTCRARLSLSTDARAIASAPGDGA
jgi:hypothetical protein